MKVRHVRHELVVGSVALGLLLTGSAQAALEEITVTATRKEANLQAVPIAVSAFGLEQIEKLQIETTTDIGQNVPNLQTYTVTANGAALQLHMRGASVQNPGFNTSESPVGIYEDDVYRGRLASANLDLADIERIEVLRGPQATLYGRNTIAGAIKVITRTPGDEFWADGSLGYGSHETIKVKGSVGGPLIDDTLSGSIAGLYHDRGEGWQKNSVLGTEPGEFENYAGRGKLRWTPGDDIDVTLTLWGVDAENDGYNGVPYAPFAGPGAVPGRPIDGFYTTRSSQPSYGETSQFGSNLRVVWDINENLRLKSITGYADIDDEFGFDLAGGGNDLCFGAFPPPTCASGPFYVDGLFIASDSNNESISQEFQLQGTNFDDAVDWLVGVYYLDEDGEQNYSGSALPFFQFIEDTDNTTESIAAFTEVNWRFADGWTATGGVRWTEDDKEFNYLCTNGAPFSCTPDANGSTATSIDETFDETTFKLGVSYETDTATFYGTFSQGFQAGGFQTLCFGNVNCVNNFYEPQTADSYEVGAKIDYPEIALRLNAAFFYVEYDDIQQVVASGASGFPTGNIGDADVTGVELEAYWSGVEGLNIFGILGLMDDDYDDIDPLSGAALAGADSLPSVPSMTFKGGFDYTTPLPWDLDLGFGLDYYYSEEYFTEATNALEIDSYGRVNGFLSVGEPDGSWSVVLSGKNLTDSDDNVSGIFSAGFANIRTPLPEREFMLTLNLAYK